MSPDEKRLLVFNDAESIYRRSFKANYFYYDIRRNLIRPLTENKAKQMCPVFSRDGRMLAYVSDNNIWLSKFDFESESQVTKDGEFGKIINGATDWVYEEEFATTYIMDFSADSRLLAFVRFDETAVSEYSFPVYNSRLYPSSLSFKYPKAGEKNSKVTCNVFDVDARTIRKINIPESNLEYIPRITFLPEGDNLAVMTLNREQNEFNMYLANARSTVCKLVLQEKSKQYIDSESLNSIHFFADKFTYISEKSGYSHIYLFNNTGIQEKALTSGSYDVTGILALDPVGKQLFYTAAESSPLNREIYKVDLVKGTKTKLSSKEGYNWAEFSSGGKYFMNSWSDATTPNYITINDASGKEIRVLESNQELKTELGKMRFPKKEFITIPTTNGTFNAWIMKPVDFNSSQKYPLVMVQYSGPNSQEVVNRFRMDWVEYLASQGFIVVSVDGRGTGARGTEFRKCTYMNLGMYESDDQIAAANYLGEQPYIDKNNIAIWGWSYGGYNVLMSMSKSNAFKAGIAIAPVTDWRFYDTVYAERFMQTPQQNESGYNNGSPILLADRLKGNLLLIHGSADDNVHLQNTMEYARALVDADKQFEMFVFTDKDHSIRGAKSRKYLYEKNISFLKRNLQ
jgi:dipeptidyl-peptidase-4